MGAGVLLLVTALLLVLAPPLPAGCCWDGGGTAVGLLSNGLMTMWSAWGQVGSWFCKREVFGKG